MGRPESPLRNDDRPALFRLASELRGLRECPYWELAKRAHYSIATLSEAASGKSLPAENVVIRYVKGCIEDSTPEIEAQFVALWEAARDEAHWFNNTPRTPPPPATDGRVEYWHDEPAVSPCPRRFLRSHTQPWKLMLLLLGVLLLATSAVNHSYLPVPVPVPATTAERGETSDSHEPMEWSSIALNDKVLDGDSSITYDRLGAIVAIGCNGPTTLNLRTGEESHYLVLAFAAKADANVSLRASGQDYGALRVSASDGVVMSPVLTSASPTELETVTIVAEAVQRGQRDCAPFELRMFDPTSHTL